MKKFIPLAIIGGLLIFASIIFADGSLPIDLDGVGSEAANEPVATMSIESSEISWTPIGKSAGLALTISGPDGLYMSQNIQDGVAINLAIEDADGNTLPDGLYSYELYTVPELGNESQSLSNARNSGQATASASGETQSGNFSVASGAFVTPIASTEGNDTTSGNELNAQVIATDLVVQGSNCVGIDCVNGESFGFDTIRLKENNLRIGFDDTSTSASFPSNDWEIEINSSNNGGGNYFAIDDVTGGRTPFKIEAGAPTNSLLVDDGGRIGVGTGTPVVEMHIVNGDSPTVRLEQDGSSGFGAQTWDLAGNETNLFIRDTTNGSKLPFRIYPNAETNSLVIDAQGEVGIGTNAPTADLHIKGGDLRVDSSNGEAKITVEETTSTIATRILLSLSNPGPVQIKLEDSDNEISWFIGTNADGYFVIDSADSPGEEFVLDDSGALTVSGGVSRAELNQSIAIASAQQSEIAALEARITELESIIESLTNGE